MKQIIDMVLTIMLIGSVITVSTVAGPAAIQTDAPTQSSGAVQSAHPAAVHSDGSPTPNAALRQIVAGENRFALDLYRELRTQPGNLCFSPYSISTVPAMQTMVASEAVSWTSANRQVSHPLYPSVLNDPPAIPSPGSIGDGKEVLTVILKNGKYALMPVTVENGKPLHYSRRVPSVYGKDQQLLVDRGDFPTLAKTGLHSDTELDGRKTITGLPVEVITYIGRPGRFSGTGFLAADEKILSVLKGDNKLVRTLGLTHRQTARPLFQVWNMILHEIECGTLKRFSNIQCFFYNGRRISLQAEGTKGWQVSIFQDEVQGRFDIDIRRSLSLAEESFLRDRYPRLSDAQMTELREKLTHLHFSEMAPYYIMRYGFYEGHTNYRADPIAIACVFGLKTLQQMEQVLPGGLYRALTAHFTARDKRMASPATIQTKAPSQSPAAAQPPAVHSDGSPTPNAALRQIVAGENRFALDLYRELRTQPGNLCVSPYSISTVLAMAYVGARGETAKQMAQTLHLTLPVDPLNTAWAALQAELRAEQRQGQIVLTIANSLWPQLGFPLLPRYLTVCRNDYDGSIKPVDYEADAEAARQKINEWVAGKTKGKIVELLEPGTVNSGTRLVLVNAIYFNGNWAMPFSPIATHDAPFHVSATQTVTVPFMNRGYDHFHYADFSNLQVLELLYAGKKLSMLVLLPNKEDGLSKLESELTPENLKHWTQNLNQPIFGIALPKFKVTSKFGLRRTLVHLGMTNAFGPADFSGINGRKDLFIGNVIHQASVKVNEHGTVAVAATASLMFGGAPQHPRIFRADHPFLFLIRDNRSGAILFIGRVTNPAKQSGSNG